MAAETGPCTVTSPRRAPTGSESAEITRPSGVASARIHGSEVSTVPKRASGGPRSRTVASPAGPTRTTGSAGRVRTSSKAARAASAT